MTEFFKTIDWRLLAAQKEALLETIAVAPSREHAEHLQGILGLIDAAQDAAQEAGFPVVYLTDDDDFAVEMRWSDDGTNNLLQYSDLVADNRHNAEFVALEPEMLAALKEGPGASYRWPVCAGLFVDVVRV